MKLLLFDAQNVDVLSLPPRGAWIEMSSVTGLKQIRNVAPPRGAWIEIFLYTLYSYGFVAVAPPTGSVD